MFPTELRIARIRAGLKLFELARKTKIEYTRLSRIELGQRVPTDDEIKRLKKVLRVELPAIQEGDYAKY